MALAILTLAHAFASGVGFAQDAPKPPAAISVVDGEGRAVAGATVQVLRLAHPGALRPDAVVLARSRTSSSGATEDALPSVRGMIVLVDHPRFERFLGTYGDGRLPATIRLGPGGLLKGKVVGSKGSEMPGATVCVAWQDESAPAPEDNVRRCTASDDDGRFAVPGLSSFAEGEVTAALEEHGQAVLDIGGAPLPEQPILLELIQEATEHGASSRNDSSGSIRVQLLSAAGIPIERFKMRVLVKRPGSHSVFRQEAEQGTAPVIIPIPGDVGQGDLLQVHFRADNHIMSEAYRLHPNPGRVTDLGIVHLDPGAMVTGRLFDAVGSQAIAGCVLELAPAGNGKILHRLRGEQHIAISNDAGAFRLGGLTEGRYYLRTECRTGPPTARLVALDDSEHVDLGELWLPAPRTVLMRAYGAGKGTVQVMDRFRELETPLATALLQSTGRENGEGPSFAEVHLAPGRYRIDLRDSTDELVASKEVQVDAYGPSDVVEVDVEYRRRTIESVLTLDGLPVSGGFVRFERILGSRAGAGVIQMDAQRGDTVTHTTMLRPGHASVHQAEVATDGSFTVPGAPDEFLWMTWFAPGGQGRVGRIWPDQPLSRFDLGGTSVVTGELRLPADRVPTQATVVLIGDLGLEAAGASTTENGTFVLPPVPPGHYRLVANTGAGMATAEVLLTANAAAPFQVLQADEDTFGEVEVRLATPGAPMVGAWLHVLGPNETLAASRLVVEDGVFNSERVPAGEVTVLWDHSAACVGADKVTLEAGRSARLDRTLQLGRLLELRCSEGRCAGEPLSLIRLTNEAGVKLAHHLTGALPGTTFSDDGRVGLGCLTPGSYSVSLWTDGRRWDAEFELDPGPEETPVTVTVRPAPG